MARRFISFLFGMVTGIIVLVLAVGGGAYLVLTKDNGMQSVQEKLDGTDINETLQINLSEEQQSKSILEYATGIISSFGNLTTENIGELEDLIGTTMLSSLISDNIGISAEAVRGSSIENIGSTITDNLTLDIMQDKFALELPDMPLFNDEEFLSRPVSEAFGSLDEETLDKIIEVVYDEDATAENPASSKFLQKLGKKTVKEASSDMDSIVDELYVTDVIEVDDNSSEVLKYFRDSQTTINGIDDAIKEMKVENAVKVDDDSHAILKEIADMTLDELSSDSALQARIDGLLIKDVITVDETSNKVLRYLADKELGKLSEAIDAMKISDAIDIVTDEEAAANPELTASSRVLQYFKKNETTLNNIDEAINDMTIGDAVKIVTDEEVVEAAKNGVTLVASSRVLQYLKNTKLDDLDADIKAMKISDAVEIVTDEEAAANPELTASHAVLQKIADMTLDELGDKDELQARIDTVKIGEVVTVTDKSEPILKALENTTLGGLNAKIQELTVADVFEDYDVGLLSAIPANTNIKDIAETLKGTVKESSLYALRAMGMFDYTLSYENGTEHDDYVKKANMHNANPQDLVDAITKIGAIDWSDTSKAVDNATTVQTAMRHTENAKFYLDTGDQASDFDNEHWKYFVEKVGSVSEAENKIRNIRRYCTYDSENHVWVLTLNNAVVKEITGEVSGATLYVNASIKVVVEGDFDILFSLDFACNNNELVFNCDQNGKIAFNCDGGYAYFRCDNIKVGSEAYSNQNIFTVKEIYKNASDKDKGEKTATTKIEVVTAQTSSSTTPPES